MLLVGLVVVRRLLGCRWDSRLQLGQEVIEKQMLLFMVHVVLELSSSLTKVTTRGTRLAVWGLIAGGR